MPAVGGRRSGSGVQGASSFVQMAGGGIAGPGSCGRGRKSFVQNAERPRAAQGSCVRAARGCVRVRASWRALVHRIKSLAPCHEPAAESRAALTGWLRFSGRLPDGGPGAARGRKPEQSDGGRAAGAVVAGAAEGGRRGDDKAGRGVQGGPWVRTCGKRARSRRKAMRSGRAGVWGARAEIVGADSAERPRAAPGAIVTFR